MKQILNYLFQHQTLSRIEAKTVLKDLSKGKFNEIEITAFTTVFLMRQITIEELEGFRDALLELSPHLDLGHDLLDIVGTGGDGKNTFNISTLAALVIAGSGQKVAKQGNYAASSISGSSSILERLGYEFKLTEDNLRKDLDNSNFCFIHAPYFHPSLKIVTNMRRNLGLRTFFNLIGPLVNPAQPEHNVIGVSHNEIYRLYRHLLEREDRNYTILLTLDGYDEISLTNDLKMSLHGKENIYSPHQLTSIKVSPKDIYGGKTIEESESIFRKILNGCGSSEQNAVVITNAAIGLLSTNKYGDYQTCYEIAEESLMNLKAKNTLQQLIKTII